METTKTLTNAALVAKRIRLELKSLFPNVKFSVTKDKGNAVNVNYTDSVTSEAIQSILNKYEAGNFNGMDDSYEYKDRTHEIDENGQLAETPRVRFLFVNRRISEAVNIEATKYINSHYQIDETQYRDINTAIYRLTVNMDLTNGFNLNYADNYPYGLFR